MEQSWGAFRHQLVEMNGRQSWDGRWVGTLEGRACPINVCIKGSEAGDRTFKEEAGDHMKKGRWAIGEE